MLALQDLAFRKKYVRHVLGKMKRKCRTCSNPGTLTRDRATVLVIWWLS